MDERQYRIINTRIGRQKIRLDRCVYFPRGLIGFEKVRNFVLLQIQDKSPFLLLQNTEDPSLGILVADPYVFLPDWQIQVGPAEEKILRARGIRDLAVLVTVTIPEGCPEKTSLNLTGPVVINTRERIGLQVPQSGTHAGSRLVISDHRPHTSGRQGRTLLAGI